MKFNSTGLSLILSALAMLTAATQSYGESALNTTYPVHMNNSDVKGFDLKLSERGFTVMPGALTLNGKAIETQSAQPIQIDPVPLLPIVDDKFELRVRSADHPLFDLVPDACCAGTKHEGPVGNLIVPKSLKVTYKDESGATVECKVDKDFRFDPAGDVIERFTDGGVKQDRPVTLTYKLFQRRIDTLVVGEDGKLHIIQGNPTQFAPIPPKVPPNFFPLANIVAPPYKRPLTESDIIPIERIGLDNTDLALMNENAAVLKKLYIKLSQGKKILIAYLGDSVTNGCFSSSKQTSYPMVFADRLKERFPKCDISVDVIAVGGATSTLVLPKFYDQEIPKHPDLIITEFVNDLSLTPKTIERNYKELSNRAQSAGSDVIVNLPHLPAPSFWGDKSWEVTAGRPYYLTMRKLAPELKFGISNVVERWLFANREGLTPMLLLQDNAIHPNDRGHEIYAEELMKCIPEFVK